MEFKPMNFKLNYEKLRPLDIAFSHSKDIAGGVISFFRDGLGDDSFPVHCLGFTSDRGQLFGTEETPKGLVENSLEIYTSDKNRIVAVYRWNGWTQGKGEAAQDELALIRRRHKENSKYDFGGLLVFAKEKLPKFLQWLIPAKPDPEKEWCSETWLGVLDKYGFKSGWSKDRPPAPDELYALLKSRSDVEMILNYYRKLKRNNVKFI